MYISYILKLLLTLFTSCVCVAVVTSEKQPTNNKVNISKHPVVIVVSFDGFRYDYLTQTDTPNLYQLKIEGVSVPYMMNEFPTKTFVNHHSIATGLHPESHGVTDNEVFDTKLNKTLGARDEGFYNYRNDVVPLWTLNEWSHANAHSGCMMWPGSHFGFGENKTIPTYSMTHNTSVSFETRVDIVMNWITNKIKPANLIFLYFEEPDSTAHGLGPESKEVKLVVQRMDNLTGYLIQKLKDFEIFEKVNLIFLSDHGFQEVSAQNIINISGIIDTKLYDRYGNTPVYHIKSHEGQLDILYTAFEQASHTFNFTVYKREKTKAGWFYGNNAQRIMPLILVADLGFVFDDFNIVMASWDRRFNRSHTVDRKYGAHGYDNMERVMHAYFLAHGPHFLSKSMVEPFHSIDLFPILCKILKIKEPPNNGSAHNVQILRQLVTGGSVIFTLVLLLGVAERGRRAVVVNAQSSLTIATEFTMKTMI